MRIDNFRPRSFTFRPSCLFVERRVAHTELVARFVRAFPGATVKHIEDCRKLLPRGTSLDERIKRGKACLAIGRKSGGLVRPYPMHSGALTPNEYYIVHAENCPCDCRYCFLQGYLHHSVPTIYANRAEILEAVRRTAALAPPHPVFHTGELSESLAWDELTHFSAELVRLFRELPEASLELRTKLANVDCLLSVEPCANAVVAWTLTPGAVHRLYERGVPAPQARVKAARLCRDAGYRVGFRLDPMIRTARWETEYVELIGLVYEYFSEGEIDSFVLGAFRWPPSLGKVIRQRPGAAPLLLEEFIKGNDGKRRYFRPLRQQMYRHVVKAIRKRDSHVEIGLCMETPHVCEQVGLAQRPERKSPSPPPHA